MFENSPVKRMHEPRIVKNLDKLAYGNNVTSSVANDPVTKFSGHSVSQNPPVLNQAPIATNQAGTSRLPQYNVLSSSTT